MTPRTPRLFAGLAASPPDQVAQGRRDSGRTTSHQPRRADGSDAAHPARPDESVPAEPAPGAGADGQWENRRTGTGALLSPDAAAVTQPIPMIFPTPAAASVTQPIPLLSRQPRLQ